MLKKCDLARRSLEGLRRSLARRVVTFALTIVAITAPPAFGQSAENVAVVINQASSASKQIGDHYVRQRGVPASNVINIQTTAEESIERREYGSTIEQPIVAALSRHDLQDRILYIVLTKGVPLRIRGTAGNEGTTSSVDSELTLLYRRMTGRAVQIPARVENPYYLGTKPIGEARPFTHRDHDIFLVTRLDAFTVEEAISLIDRAQAPSAEGRIVLDQRSGLKAGPADAWLTEAAGRLGDLGHGSQVVLENTSQGARDVQNVLGYYSWGSNDPQNRVRRFNMQFVPGALAATFVSTDARTFQNPPETWMPMANSTDPRAWFGGSPQTLTGDLIREGATGVAGHVAEPYLKSTVRPEILFPAYLTGFNLVEAFYLALPHLSWQTVVVGDPLCTPFPRKVLTRSDIEDPIDPELEMPGVFGKRRLELARAATRDVPAKALSLMILAEARAAKTDMAGARKALEGAAELAPTVVGIQLTLALLHEQIGESGQAVDGYRKVLELQPNNPVALNNLAYALAVHQKAPVEALPLAQKAVSLAPNDPTLLDTLAWIQHLLGNTDEAAKLFTQALRRGTDSPEILLHAAIVYAAAGAHAAAKTQLDEALRLDPSFASRDDVKALRATLGAR